MRQGLRQGQYDQGHIMFKLFHTYPARIVAGVFCAITACLPPASAAPAIEDYPEPVQVEASKVGDAVVVDALFSVEAPLALVWQVLIDYNHASTFIAGLDESRILAQSGNHLEVLQKGSGWVGPFKMSFESVRGVNLTPMSEIRSYIISGTVKKSDGHATLSADSTSVTVTYHNEIVAGVWVPPGIGSAFIARQVRAQFQDLRAEVLRRKAISVK